MAKSVIAAAALGAAVLAAAPATANVNIFENRCVSVSAPGGCAFDGNINDKTSLATQNAYNLFNNSRPAAGADITLNWLFQNVDTGFGDTVKSATELNGSWSTPGYLVDFVAVKAGSEFVLYKLPAPVSFGSWSSANILNKQGRPQAMSHVAFFGQRVTDHFGTTPVPEPATWAMMLGGFGVIGAAARRRRQTRTTVSFA